MKFEKKIGNNSEIQVDNLEKVFKFVPKLDLNGDLSYNKLKDKPTIPSVPTKLSEFTNDLTLKSFTNDAGFLTQHQDINGKLNASNGTATNLTVNGFISNGEVEIFGWSSPSKVGPHIDFHHPDNSSEDYTVRLIENTQGELSILASKGLKLNGNQVALKSDIPSVSLFKTQLDSFSGWKFTSSQIRTDLSHTIKGYSGFTPMVVRCYCNNNSNIIVLNAYISGSYNSSSDGFTCKIEARNLSTSTQSSVNFSFEILWIKTSSINNT